MAGITLSSNNKVSGNWGKGLEAFYSQHLLQRGQLLQIPKDYPHEITPDYLMKMPQPGSTSILRMLALAAISRGLEINDPDELIDNLAKGLTKFKIGQSEEYLIGHVRGYEIPLFTASGLMHIDVNPALGLLWRLDNLNPLTRAQADYQRLAVRFREMGDIPLPVSNIQNTSLISDETLASVTHVDLVNTKTLFTEISDFLKVLSESGHVSEHGSEQGGKPIENYFNRNRQIIILKSPSSAAKVIFRL